MKNQEPQKSKEHREAMIANDYCPECGGCLDTGWECNDCGFDAMSELYKDNPEPTPFGPNRREAKRGVRKCRN